MTPRQKRGWRSRPEWRKRHSFLWKRKRKWICDRRHPLTKYRSRARFPSSPSLPPPHTHSGFKLRGLEKVQTPNGVARIKQLLKENVRILFLIELEGRAGAGFSPGAIHRRRRYRAKTMICGWGCLMQIIAPLLARCTPFANVTHCPNCYPSLRYTQE